MGCDIHIMVEKLVNGKWIAQSGVNESDVAYYKEMLESKKNNPDGNYGHLTEDYIEECIKRASKTILHDWIYGDRNYDLFSILADVRNGYGFAGVKTGDGFIPISEPRGVPKDVGVDYAHWVNEWNGDGHSHSYHTVRQLVEYPHWESRVTKCGVVSENEYKVFKEKGYPESWCGDCSGRDIVKVTNREMDSIIDGSTLRGVDKKYFTSVEWKDAYKNRIHGFFSESVPKLKELAGDDLDSVRIVFFFDN